MSDGSTYALGLRLRLVPAEEGGRDEPLRGGCPPDSRLRPRWGLRDGALSRGTDAPVIGLSIGVFFPGETADAVILATHPDRGWADVRVGDELTMHEGPAVTARAVVAWKREVPLPISRKAAGTLTQWCLDGVEPAT